MAHSHAIEVIVLRDRAAADKLHAQKQRERAEATAKVTGSIDAQGNGKLMTTTGNALSTSSTNSVSPAMPMEP